MSVMLLRPEQLDRIERIKAKTQVDRYWICIERFRISVDNLNANRNDPVVTRRGKQLKAYAERMPIDIMDDELIVGIGASKYMGLEIDPDYGLWPQDEIDSLKEDGFLIDPQDEIDLQELNRRFDPPMYLNYTSDIIYKNERIANMRIAGIPLPPWKPHARQGGVGGYAQSGLGLGPALYLIVPEYERIIHEGIDAIKQEVRDELDAIDFCTAGSVERFRFLEAAYNCLDAMTIMAARYAKLAEEKAAVERDPKRRAELKQIAENCRRVPAKPARTFWEGMQALWFSMLFFSPCSTLPGGRFDQYMYPLYKADLDAGRITPEDAVELLCLLRLKDMELNRVSGKEARKKNSGMAKWHNFIIGGVKPGTGEDASNDLSYLLLDAAMITKTPHHTISLRVHEKTPEALMVKSLECVRMGLGMPAFLGDRSYIATFTSRGVPLEDAQDYVACGCLDAEIPGRSRTLNVPMMGTTIIFDIFRHRGIDKRTGIMVGIDCGDFTSFESYDRMIAAFREELRYIMHLVGESNNIALHIIPEYVPDPLRSVLIRGGVKAGKDAFARTDIVYNNPSTMMIIGICNLSDSFTAIKKLCFDEKKYSLSELYQALEDNWVGHDEMRHDFLAAPKFGNDDDYADDVMRSMYEMYCELVEQVPTILGVNHLPSGISVTAHQPVGALTGATPDGRKAGEILADGSLSPMHGMDKNGVTSILKSALKINQDPMQATLLNMKFHPSALKTEADLHKLAALIRTYMVNGGKHIQFNVVAPETLLAAQKDKEQYRNLIVRVAGYSTYFVTLSEKMQNEVIERTTHVL